ncbi:MAG: DNA polymerase III subunit alpha [Pyrinomonadaceae bacterium]
MSNKKEFVHLHLHTDYSLLTGSIQLKSLSAKLEEFGMNACAITDQANMFGAVSFYQMMKKIGKKPIIGYEALLTFGDISDKTSMVKPGELPNYRLVLLATDYAGYLNLCELASRAYTEGFFRRPRISLTLLAKYSSGLIGLSAAETGAVGHFLRAGNIEKAAENAELLREALGDKNFYLEIQNHGADWQESLVTMTADLGEKLEIPLVATNNVYYLTKEDARAQEILMCIGDGKTINDSTRKRFQTENYYLRSAEEMWDVFGKDFPKSLDATVEIANRCNVEIPLGESYHLPNFPIPEDAGTTDSIEYFKRVAWEGFENRKSNVWEPMIETGDLKYPIEVYEERLKTEIQIILDMKFPGYFLIVWDFIRYARAHDIPVGPGRGSAAGSLVAYCLEITNIDPIQYDLLFERFLNPERISMPDIDIDFCVRGRGDVIDYVSNFYGRESVCQIITFGTMASKAAIKDVGRALQMPYAEVEKIAKLIPPPVRGRNVPISQALEQVAELRDSMDSDPRVKELVDLAMRVEGCARHTSVHAAGVVISPKPLNELVPVSISSRNEELTSQYSMKDLEKVGMLKMDFLALTTLTIINECLMTLKRKKGMVINWDSVSLKDEATFKLFGEGATDAVFQFESGGMQEICRKLKPRELEDLSALNALYRPGPLDGGMVDDFIARHRGDKAVTYLVPEMKEILENTYGILVYQEQIMQIAQKLGGYSLGEADKMRRAMGKKEREAMDKEEARFIGGAANNGIAKDKAQKVFSLMKQFADYGFNRSHSVAYAYVAFQTAYLKAHYPAYFYAAVLSSEADNTEKIYKYSSEMRNSGVQLLPPDVNESELGFTPTEDAVRFGLNAIKGIGSSTVESIIAAREKGGEFKSLFEFVSRLGQGAINRRGMESLIGAGAFDTTLDKDVELGLGRARLFASVQTAIDAAQNVWKDRDLGQSALFGDAISSNSLNSELEIDVVPWGMAELSAQEKAAVGFYLSSHPLDAFRNVIDGLGLKPISNLLEIAEGERIEIAGMVSRYQAKFSKRGNRFCIFRLEDKSGGVKCLGWSEAYNSFADLLSDDALVIIEGKIESNEGQEVTIIIESVKDLRELSFSQFSHATVEIPELHCNDKSFEEIFGMLNKAEGGCDVYLRIPLERKIEVELHPQRLRIDLSIEQRLKKIGCNVIWNK